MTLNARTEDVTPLMSLTAEGFPSAATVSPSDSNKETMKSPPSKEEPPKYLTGDRLTLAAAKFDALPSRLQISIHAPLVSCRSVVVIPE